MKDQYKFGVVGHRISYSGSPKIFQSIADILGMPVDEAIDFFSIVLNSMT